MLRAVGLADLVIAAVAQRHRVTIMHYDGDVEVVTRVTGQPVEWVVPPAPSPDGVLHAQQETAAVVARETMVLA